MKKLLLTTAATLLTVAAFAQGTMNFANASSVAGWNPAADRNVKFDATATAFNAAIVPGALVTTNAFGLNLSSLSATLYWAAAGTTDRALFTQAIGATATFKGSTSATAGSWFAKTATLGATGNGIAAGVTGAFYAVVWDTSKSADPLSAAAKQGLWGESAIFAYTVPGGATPAPAEYLPNNMATFSIGIVPEPSSMALAGLAAASLLIFRRRK